VGLLAGENDHRAVTDSGDGRSINRHDYTTNEVGVAIRRPVVQRVLDLVRLRNSHPAFAGHLDVATPDETTIRLGWHHGDDACNLEVDLRSGRTELVDRRDGVEHRSRP
jgi:hypothetical protein